MSSLFTHHRVVALEGGAETHGETEWLCVRAEHSNSLLKSACSSKMEDALTYKCTQLKVFIYCIIFC